MPSRTPETKDEGDQPMPDGGSLHAYGASMPPWPWLDHIHPSMPRLNPNHHGLCFLPSIPPIFRSFHGMVASIPNHPFFHPSIRSVSMHPPCLVLGPVLVGYPVAHEGVPRVGPTCFLFLHPPRPFLPLPWIARLCRVGGTHRPSISKGTFVATSMVALLKGSAVSRKVTK